MPLPSEYKFRDLQMVKDANESLASHKRATSGKAKARYVHSPQDADRTNGAPAPGGKRANTPGGPPGS